MCFFSFFFFFFFFFYILDVLDMVHVMTFFKECYVIGFSGQFCVSIFPALKKLGSILVSACAYAHTCVHPFVQAMILKLNVWIPH